MLAEVSLRETRWRASGGCGSHSKVVLQLDCCSVGELMLGVANAAYCSLR